MTSGERQTTYGWLIAIETFLAGAGGGIFLISFVLDLLRKGEPLARTGGVLGPVLALIGSFFLLADIGSRTRAYRVLTNPSSWMSRGTFIMVAFVIFGLSYSVPSYGLSEWKASGAGRGFGVVGAVFSVLLVLYPGFLLSAAKAVPIWNVPALPPLFFLSGLCTGTAALLLTDVFFTTALGASDFHVLSAASVMVIFMMLILLGSCLETARHSGIATIASIRLLMTPLFVGGALVAGLLAPLGLLSYSVMVSDLLTLRILAALSGVLLLAGGLLLRGGIIRAGVSLPLRAT